MTLPTTPPATFEAGTTVSFTQAPTTTALGLVSPPTWGLVWHVVRTDGADSASVTATNDGAQWTVTLTAAASEALTAGDYRWALRATASGVVQTVASGTLTVTPNLTAPGNDVRTWEERTIEVVEAALAGTIEGETRMYMIAGRQVQTFSPDELMRLRDRLRNTIAKQRRGGARAMVTLVTGSERPDPWA
jgi:hypothetical protein